MKKFLNSKTIISISIVCVIVTVSVMGVFLFSVNDKKIQHEKNEIDNNFKQYFNDKNIDYKNSTNIKFDIDKYRSLFLYSLTNWQDNNNQSNIKFMINLVEKNLINILKLVIKDTNLFNDNKSLYINAKYSVNSEKELLIDVRWADRNSLIMNQNLKLYWNKLNLKINDLI